MPSRAVRGALGALAATIPILVVPLPTAGALPVCTDGYMGGPPLAVCGGRVFPEPALARGYVQFTPDPVTGFIEYQHGIEFLSQSHPRWISVFRLDQHLADPTAVSSGADEIRAHEPGDTGDGRPIWVIKITDHQVPDTGKQTMFFNLAVHGNERGGLEGGLRTAEDLAIAATDGGTVVDGVANYESTTGRAPTFHEYEVRDLLRQQVVYLATANPDGWAIGDFWNVPPLPYARGNSMGTDLNRQMPTIGRIDPDRNPLEEDEARSALQFMREVAAGGRDGLMTHGADIHGELTSNAYVDIMYPAGQFSSLQHRRLMAIAERVKSVVDATLYEGIIDEIENATGGNTSNPDSDIPTKPAAWATVWDTLGYTDSGFIGDYLATDLATTAMDYEIFLNHSVPDKVWNVYLQQNHVDGTRAMIKTAMAYAMFQEEEFTADNVDIDTGGGRAGYVFNPDTVTDSDEDGPGVLPGPNGDGIGANGRPVEQRPYSATNMRFFADHSKFLAEPFVRLLPADVAAGAVLEAVDSLVLADVALPADADGRPVDSAAYFRSLRGWVERGGNLILTDRALHALGQMNVVPAAAVTDIAVYQPHADFVALDHPMAAGLRPNARQLVEAPILGYGIGNQASPMTVVDPAAWTAAAGVTVATTDDAVSIGELALGKGKIRVVGGALPTPTENDDHRYGLRDYALTYTGLFVLENSLRHDAPGLGEVAPAAPTRPPTDNLPATGGPMVLPALATLTIALVARHAGRRLRRRGEDEVVDA